VVKNAHAAGLFVHPYTFRCQAPRLAAEGVGVDEQPGGMGVDGVFADFPDHAKAARD